MCRYETSLVLETIFVEIDENYYKQEYLYIYYDNHFYLTSVLYLSLST